MIWWLRLRRVLLLAVITTAFWAVALSIGDTGLPLPQLGGATSASVPLILLAPLAPAIALNTGHIRAPLIEATAGRTIARGDTALAAATVALTALVMSLALTNLGPEPELAGQAVRNLALYTGMALIGRTLLGGPASTVPPVAFALATATFGYGPQQTAHWWAWPAAHPTDPLAALATLIIVAYGLRTAALQDRPRRHLR
ncbi:hypothetical protein [Streptomyces sp. NPDC091212]|uniref:hypothetical protein n=1 Tax=Streptomyces sp. NPDC091212 TaxID=3155191 RepID=UPI003447DFA8